MKMKTWVAAAHREITERYRDIGKEGDSREEEKEA